MRTMNERPIRVRDRRTGVLFDELVYGGAGVDFLYRTAVGSAVERRFLAAPWFSRLLGRYYRSHASRSRVAPFVRQYGIDLGEFEQVPWDSFDAFFQRAFREGARRFDADPRRFPAFAEARYLAWARHDADATFPVKGTALSAEALLGIRGAEHAARFREGPVIVARLAPVDYHRYHYPDDGTTLGAWRIDGCLHSVNPRALAARPDAFAVNSRRVAILATRNFGTLAYVEVGAIGVGRIEQTAPEDRPFARGSEKGRFGFGASTVIVLGEPGAFVPDDDLVSATGRTTETLVRLGEPIATGAG